MLKAAILSRRVTGFHANWKKHGDGIAGSAQVLLRLWREVFLKKARAFIRPVRALRSWLGSRGDLSFKTQGGCHHIKPA